MKKQNFLLIVVDQLTWRALPAYGNRWVKTPNIDKIVREGVAFSECYTPCPLCQPARTAFWTGRYPHETKVLSNGKKWPVKNIGDEIVTLGDLFRNSGYETIHFGKTHDAGGLRGFEVIEEKEEFVENIHEGVPFNFDTYQDRYTTNQVVGYFEQFSDKKRDRPFMVVADLVNPHNICGWIGAFADMEKDCPLQEPLPPLPENFVVEDMQTRPKAVQYICCSHIRQAQASQWDEKRFRQYLAAYYAYLEMVDSEIGRILQALEQSGAYQDTTIVFWADHGDSMVARKRVTKQVDFYEEVTRVPFVVAGKGINKQEKTCNGLVSLLDIVPTLCGLADIVVPDEVQGVDLSAFLKGQSHMPKREYVVSEWHTEWGYTVSPARMIRTQRYKYMRYIENGEIELYDLVNDPLEKQNLGYIPEYADVVKQMEQTLQQHMQRTKDDFDQLEVIVDKRWRSHPQGYENHRGIAAPQME